MSAGYSSASPRPSHNAASLAPIRSTGGFPNSSSARKTWTLPEYRRAAAFQAEGASVREVAAKLGRSFDAVQAALWRAQRDGILEKPRGLFGASLKSARRRKTARMLRQRGKTYAEIAEALGCSPVQASRLAQFVNTRPRAS